MQILILTAALGFLFLFFGFIERRWPAIRGQRRRRHGWKTDVAWYYFSATLGRPITIAGLVPAIIVVAILTATPLTAEGVASLATRETAITRQPAMLQALELLVLFDLLGYWAHRCFHRRSLLWRFHAVHHSSEQLDWLASVRVHPVNEIGQRAMQAVPLLLLGYRAELVAAFVPLFTLFAIGLHANVPWSFGRLRYVIASPLFHRWHHTSEEEGLDTNFAGLFPWIDALFGTLYLPEGRQPTAFGITEGPIATGLHRQLLYPFRRRPAAPVVEA